MLVYENRASKMKFFRCRGFFFINFDFKNWRKNEFKDNNEKSRSRSRKRVSQKSDFKALWPRLGAASLGVKYENLYYGEIYL